MSEDASLVPCQASRVNVLLEDPSLAEGILSRDLPAAARAAAATVQWLERGAWRPSPGDLVQRGMLGLLVLDGLLLRRVTVRGAPCAELLGPGDLLRPWSIAVEQLSSIPVRSSFWVLTETRLAVLDREFAVRVARWPELTDALLERVTDRTRRLAYNLATQRSKRVDERLWLVLLQIADRWGIVTPHGVAVTLPGLSHRVLGSLIAARRPSVTTALGGLVDRGLVRRLPGGFLLCGAPSPNAVRDLPTRDGITLAVVPVSAP
jgi:CRP-like cAMP-binding protein